MPEITILVGTQTGNAESMSEDLQAAMEANCEATVEVKMMDDLKADALKDGSNFLICSSTWGDGELPDNAIDFHQSFEDAKPSLAGKQFGICALGDHDYDPYFCEAAKIFTKALEGCGAKKVIDHYEINQGPTDDDIMGAMRWSLDFVKKCRGE
jgi:flavodoxin